MQTIKLNNGIECPVIGLGTFMLSPADAQKSAREALKMGYRLIGGLKARPDGIVKSGLYRFNEGAAVSVTYDSNGDMCMELGALDTEEREPDPQESEHLRQIRCNAQWTSAFHHQRIHNPQITMQRLHC